VDAHELGVEVNVDRDDPLDPPNLMRDGGLAMPATLSGIS
jgi:hypothetical protein